MIKLSKSDFENATPILIIHQSGAGGKTIGNLLALGDNAVFMDNLCVKLQHQGHFTITDKLDFLLNRLEKSKTDKNWNDLNMGESRFLTPDFESPLTKDYSRENFYEEMRWVIDSKKYFFLSAHNLQEVKITLKIWPNCKIIFLTNSYEFIVNKRKNYTFTMQNEWDSFKGSEWPEQFPKNLEEYYKLDNYIIQELEKFYNNTFYETLVLFDEKLSEKEILKITKNNVIKWNVEWYSDTLKVVKEMQKLYDKLSIKNFNAKAIETYFNAWYSMIQLKK